MLIAPHNTKIYKWFNALHGLQLFSPIAILYFVSITHSYTAAASLFSAAYITQVLLEVPTGVLSDKYGRVRTITFGAVCYFVSLVLYVVGGGYAMLFVGALLEGAMRAFYSGNNQSLLFESGLQDGQDRYHHDMAGTETFFHVSATVSAVLGGVIATWSLRSVYVVSLLPAALTILVSTRFIEPQHAQSIKEKSLYHIKDSLKYLVQNKRLRLASVASSLEFGTGQAMFNLTLAFYKSVWPLWAVGVVRALSGLYATISFAFSGKIIDKLTPLKTVIYSGLWARVLSFIGLLFPGVASPLVISSSSLSFGTMTVAESVLLQKEFTSKQRATLGSITSLLGSMWYALASLGFGLLADHFGLQKALLCGLVPLSVSTLLYVRLKRH